MKSPRSWSGMAASSISSIASSAARTLIPKSPTRASMTVRMLGMGWMSMARWAYHLRRRSNPQTCGMFVCGTRMCACSPVLGGNIVLAPMIWMRQLVPVWMASTPSKWLSARNRTAFLRQKKKVWLWGELAV